MNSAINTPSSSEGSAPHTVAWVRTWGAFPQAPNNSVSCIEPFENATLRQIVRITGGGHRIRIRISNEYGTAPLTIGSSIPLATMGVASGGGAMSHGPGWWGRGGAGDGAGCPVLCSRGGPGPCVIVRPRGGFRAKCPHDAACCRRRPCDRPPGPSPDGLLPGWPVDDAALGRCVPGVSRGWFAFCRGGSPQRVQGCRACGRGGPAAR